MSSEGLRGGAPTRRGQGEGLPQSCRGPRAAPFTVDSGCQTVEDHPGPSALGAQRPGTPRWGCAQPRPIPTAVAPRPGQAAAQPRPTLHAAGTQTTRVHTQHALGHVTGCIYQGS